MERYELTAAVALWRGDEVLFMKRARGFSAGGWFLPAGHVEPGERPVEAAARELLEEAGIALDAGALAVADVMSYATGDRTAHCIVFNARCPEGAEPVLNDEHLVARWYAPAAFTARFLDLAMLRERSLDEPAIALASEVARMLGAVTRARGAA